MPPRKSSETSSSANDAHGRPAAPAHAYRTGRSQHLLHRLKRARKLLMHLKVIGSENTTHKHKETENNSEGSKEEPTDETLKVYMLVANKKKPTVSATVANTSKNLSVYIGRSATDGTSRAMAHNNRSVAVVDTRTRPNAGRWEFCMWAALPDTYRKSYFDSKQRSLSKLVQQYWTASHGLSCKIKRGLEIITLLGLSYGVTENYKDVVSKLEQRHRQRQQQLQRQNASVSA